MANDDRNRPQTSIAPLRLEPIKVKKLQTQGSGVVLPKPATSSMLLAGTRQSGEVITIDYEPWHRHHRVRELEGGKVKTEVCIPESWVAYTPEEPGA